MGKNKKSVYFYAILTILMFYELIAAILSKWTLGIYLGIIIIIFYFIVILYYIHKLKNENVIK
jgi:Ca2+/Na+ antiporter